MNLADPSVSTVVSELEGRIHSRFPGATFSSRSGIDDPDAIYITAVVGVDDPDDVLDLVFDRLLELQIDEQMPIYVVPIHTTERVAETRRRLRAHDLASLYAS